jgi:hypothetical protein
MPKGLTKTVKYLVSPFFEVNMIWLTVGVETFIKSAEYLCTEATFFSGTRDKRAGLAFLGASSLSLTFNISLVILSMVVAEDMRSSRPSYPNAFANSSLQSSIVVSGSWNVAIGSSVEFWSCMRAEMVSREALIFAISRCTSDWQLHMSSRRGGSEDEEEEREEQHPVRDEVCCSETWVQGVCLEVSGGVGWTRYVEGEGGSGVGCACWGVLCCAGVKGTGGERLASRSGRGVGGVLL